MAFFKKYKITIVSLECKHNYFFMFCFDMNLVRKCKNLTIQNKVVLQ